MISRRVQPVMKKKRGGFFFSGLSSLALLFFFVPLALPPGANLSFRPAPLWWDIAVNLETNGEYTMRGNASTYRGSYAFAVRWTGCLEKDDHDYLLYRVDCRLCDWKARETASSEEFTGILMEGDFREKPSFDLKYIFRRGSDLCLDFVTSGISVPQSGTEEGFPLLFPSSQENRQHDFEVDYNAGVQDGSNSVAIKETDMYAGPLTKDFSWTWSHQQWQLQQRQTVLTSQSHRAKVTISINPHYFRPE
jgi:hypothetical protein